MDQYFEYLKNLTLENLNIWGTIGMLAMIIGTSAFVYSEIKKKGYSYLSALIVSSILIFIICTIAEYNINYDKGKFKLSTYNPKKKSFQSNSSNSNTTSSSNNKVNSFSNIPIDKQVSDNVDSSEFLKEIKLNREQINSLKRILSNSNDDPDNLDGKVCGNENKRCDWCGTDFTVTKYYCTYKSTLNNIIFNPFSLMGLELGSLFIDKNDPSKNTMNSDFQKLITDYKNGERYFCEVKDNNKFCSEKCKYESKNR